MHSTGVVSSLLLAAAVAFAAPAQNPAAGSSSSTSVSTYKSSPTPDTPLYKGEPAYTPDSPYKPDSPYTPSASSKDPAKPTASPVSSPAKGDDSYEASLPLIVPINTRGGNQDLITKLLTAPTQQERVRLLNLPGDYVFDFNNPGDGAETVGKAGHTVAATAKTFPALIGNGVAMTVGFLGPCGMNTAHVHNRATEINIVVEGRLVTNFQIENGVQQIANTISKYQMTVFPQGSVHQEYNPDCSPAVFVAGFNNVDPGVEQIAQTFFGLRPDVVAATLGGVNSINGADLETFRDYIPANVALGVESCLKKCNIQKNAKRDIHEYFSAEA